MDGLETVSTVAPDALEQQPGDTAVESPPNPAEEIDRRSLFKRPFAVALAAVGGVILAGCDFTSATFDRRIHLLKRLTYGATPASRDHIVAIGEAAWLNEQLAPATIDTAAVDAKIAALPALSMSNADLLTNYPMGSGATEAGNQLRLAATIRAAESPAQLFERMVEFWSDHLNVPALGNPGQRYKIVDDREVIRPHALGKFKDLLVASAQSPAMLDFLDNANSFVGAINENYGRELLELHTRGVDGGYTETDVVNTARLLTGWTINSTTKTFVFKPAKNDPSPLTILGWVRPTGGNPFDHGVQFLQFLAGTPQTAQHVCRKLAVRFVSDQPDPGLVTAMVNAWLANDTAIVPVLRAMVAHSAFDAAAGKKFRRPLEYFEFVLRALGAQTAATTKNAQIKKIQTALDAMGQTPFGWPAPNGYPDVEGAWLNSGALLGRWNTAADIVGGAFGPITFSKTALRASLSGKTATEIYSLVSNQLIIEAVTDVGRGFLNTQLGWTDSTIPTAAQIDTALPTIMVAVLVAADVMYR
jgi:uncharacterized protein (DUF1800 family)